MSVEGRRRQGKHDLGLDARLGKRRQWQRIDACEIVHAAVEHVPQIGA